MAYDRSRVKQAWPSTEGECNKRGLPKGKRNRHEVLTGNSGLPDGLVSEGTAARDDSNLALLVDVPGHDS